jgi:hypothetical protein
VQTIPRFSVTALEVLRRGPGVQRLKLSTVILFMFNLCGAVSYFSCEMGRHLCPILKTYQRRTRISYDQITEKMVQASFKQKEKLVIHNDDKKAQEVVLDTFLGHHEGTEMKKTGKFL